MTAIPAAAATINFLLISLLGFLWGFRLVISEGPAFHRPSQCRTCEWTGTLRNCGDLASVLLCLARGALGGLMSRGLVGHERSRRRARRRARGGRGVRGCR